MCRNMNRESHYKGAAWLTICDVTGWSEDKSLMPSWRGRLTLVSVNAPAAGSMPLGPPQRMHGSRSAWRRSWCPWWSSHWPCPSFGFPMSFPWGSWPVLLPWCLMLLPRVWYFVRVGHKSEKALISFFIWRGVVLRLFVQICLVQLEMTLDRWRHCHTGHLTSTNSPRR